MGPSIYNVETREGTDGRAYIMEVSPRGGGNRLAEMLRYATGVDLVTNAVRAAVGMQIRSQLHRFRRGLEVHLVLQKCRCIQVQQVFCEERFLQRLHQQQFQGPPRLLRRQG